MGNVCGIDESGRGPVIGPMVIAGVVVTEDKLDELKNLGVKDSKLLSARKREYLFDKITEKADKYEIIIVYPKEIDETLRHPSLNLNILEKLRIADIINKLKPDKAIIDCPSPNANAFKMQLKAELSYKPELIVEHKADTNYVIVGAASVLAKVTRDREINNIKKKIGIYFGSGYATDPKTQEFLKNNHDKHDIFRKEWSPYRRVDSLKRQKKLEDFNN